MKKLNTKSILVVLFSAFFFISCEKEPVQDNPVTSEPKMDLDVSYKWYKGQGDEMTGKGNGTVEITDGELVEYTFTPTKPCDCIDGEWEFKSPMMHNRFDGKSGKLITTINGKGKWKFYIWFTCNDKAKTVHKVAITVTTIE